MSNLFSKIHHLPLNRYKELPIDALQTLIVQLVGELLEAADSNSHDFKAKLKELDLIYSAMQEKTKTKSKK